MILVIQSDPERSMGLLGGGRPGRIPLFSV